MEKLWHTLLSVLSLLERRYPRTFPRIAHGESLRFFVERDHLERLRRELAVEADADGDTFDGVAILELFQRAEAFIEADLAP